MKHSTRLGVLGAMLLAVSACGGDDAKLDPTKLVGLWAVDGSEAAGGGSTVVLDPINEVAGRASPDGSGHAGALVLDGAKGTIAVGSELYDASFTAGTPDELVLTKAGKSVTYTKRTVTARTNFNVSGHVGRTAGTLSDTPRIALVTIVRDNNTGGSRYLEVPATEEPGIDQALDFTGGDTASYLLSRSQGALGLERISYGTTASISLNAVVAYEDRDHDGKLGRFDIDACTDPAVDCIRDVASIVLSEVDGVSAELHAAGYNLIPVGWGLSVVVPDERRADGTTLVSLDTDASYDVVLTLRDDPTTAAFPDLEL